MSENETKERIVATARTLGGLEQRLDGMRTLWRTRKQQMDAAVKAAIESDEPQDGPALAAWRNDVIQAYQTKLDTTALAKETMAQAGADLKAARKKLREQIETMDQLDLRFDDTTGEVNQDDVPE